MHAEAPDPRTSIHFIGSDNRLLNIFVAEEKNIAIVIRCEAVEWVGESLGTGLDPSIPIISLDPPLSIAVIHNHNISPGKMHLVSYF